MPPKKKSKTSGAAAAKPATKSPCAAYFERLKTAEDSNSGLGSMLVQGIKNEDSDEDEDDEDEDKAAAQAKSDAYTVAQVAQLRHIIINKRRAAALEEMSEMVLGEQAGESLMSFSTSFSYEVLDSFEHFFSLLQKKKSADEKFDYLFSYTYNLNEYDVWVHDHECGWGAHTPLAKLAKTWKTVLAKDDAVLNIADGFTRRGIVALLKQFKEKVEGIDQDDEPDIKFKFA